MGPIGLFLFLFICSYQMHLFFEFRLERKKSEIGEIFSPLDSKQQLCTYL